MPDHDHPAPPSRAALAAALAQAADAEPLLVDRPVREIGWGVQRIDLAGGWVFWIWWDADQLLGPMSGARAPDGAWWGYGCDRWPDWNAGPDAVVLDPLRHLIAPEQRERLRLRLLEASCWPPPDPLPEPPSMAEINAMFHQEEEWLLLPS